MAAKKVSGSEGFVRRLNQACDDLPSVIPPFGEGRQIELAKRMGMSQQGVRKWFSGEAMPRREAMRRLAKVLEVEEPWLALGIMPDISYEDRRINARNLDGAVMLVMGMMPLAGAACALPREYREVRTIAVIQTNDMHFDFIDLDAISVPKHMQRRPGGYTLRMSRADGRYFTGESTWKCIKHFGEMA